ncbi:MAG: exopolyphosphatase [Myxococcales bacterium]|nr:exopolyphosphatase [Myxococcales bacterium]
MNQPTPSVPSAQTAPQQATFAAVDLGSNSFHMVVAREVDGELQIIDRIKEMVRLAGGLNDDGSLDPVVQERALSCLQRFGQRLAAADPSHVRVVGTNTLRKAQHAAGFRDRAREALGHPIEIIPGREEARLVYLGVSHSGGERPGRNLVVDIGGGSTECVIGERFEPIVADSLYMGCVSYSQRYFPGGVIDEQRMHTARMAARQKVEPIGRAYADLGWDKALGSSGTIGAVGRVLRENGWSKGPITPDGLRQLRDKLVTAGHVDNIKLLGLKEERVPVIAGGVAVLSGVFDQLQIAEMWPADGALREGVLYDLQGRVRHEDVRDRTIARLRGRFVVDVPQARRVRTTALTLLNQVAAQWHLEGPWPQTLLRWASELHELGLAVSYGGHHRHGAYVVENADMPGFSRDNQAILAAMILGHRRKLKHEAFANLSGSKHRRFALRLTVILRLAVRLNRSRSDEPTPELTLSAKGDRLRLALPEAWLSAHPLTVADLATEKQRLHHAGIKLELSSASPPQPAT